MVDVTQETAVTLDELATWFKLKQQLAQVKSAEALLRSRVFKFFFPTPVEGSKDNKYTIPDGTGAVLQATHVINRDVDMGELTALRDAISAEGSNLPKLKLDELIKWKPELVKAEYNKLSDEDRAVFDRVLIVKPGSPSLDIVHPKRPQ